MCIIKMKLIFMIWLSLFIKKIDEYVMDIKLYFSLKGIFKFMFDILLKYKMFLVK